MTERSKCQYHRDLAKKFAARWRDHLYAIDAIFVHARENRIDLPEAFCTAAGEMRAMHKRAERAVALAYEALRKHDEETGR